MTIHAPSGAFAHSHTFLGDDHARSERNVWAVIALTSAMMVAEIVGGAMFGSIALVADGLHMSTHAGALLLAAVAYTLARRKRRRSPFHLRHRQVRRSRGIFQRDRAGDDRRPVAYESISRLFAPTPIAFAQAIPIAVLGLAVNAAAPGFSAAAATNIIITATDMLMATLTITSTPTTRRSSSPSPARLTN